MMSDNTAQPISAISGAAPDAAGHARTLPPAAQRALAEAQARRAAQEARAAALEHPVELGGRNGPDPVRYDDWENNGIASDF